MKRLRIIDTSIPSGGVRGIVPDGYENYLPRFTCKFGKFSHVFVRDSSEWSDGVVAEAPAAMHVLLVPGADP